MYKWISRLLPALSGRFVTEDEPGPADLAADDYALVEQAHQEWLDARAHFDEVDDPDLVDYAVYTLAAAENRYRYLLRKARRRAAGLPVRRTGRITVGGGK